MLQRVAACCSVLQRVAACRSVLQSFSIKQWTTHCFCSVAVCCSMLQRVAACCSVLQCVAEVLQIVELADYAAEAAIHVVNRIVIRNSIYYTRSFLTHNFFLCHSHTHSFSLFLSVFHKHTHIHTSELLGGGYGQ